MPRKARPIDAFVWNLSDADLLVKVWSEEVQGYDRQNEEYNDQKLFEEEYRFGKIDIKKMTNGRSVEFTQALIISELSGKSVDEILVEQVQDKLSKIEIGNSWASNFHIDFKWKHIICLILLC